MRPRRTRTPEQIARGKHESLRMQIYKQVREEGATPEDVWRIFDECRTKLSAEGIGIYPDEIISGVIRIYACTARVELVSHLIDLFSSDFTEVGRPHVVPTAIRGLQDLATLYLAYPSSNPIWGLSGEEFQGLVDRLKEMFQIE